MYDVKEAHPLQRFEMSREEAIAYMKERDEDYKVALIEELPASESLSFFKQGEYSELCAGPHVSNTCLIKSFKLLSIAGAYWRGDEKNKMLTRIYGVSFPKAAELREGYVEISTPMMLNRELWETSGHWDHYRGNMYTTVIDEVDFAVKPMNCPGGMLVYKMEPHSYRDLPIRMGELGLVHRHEKSGQLHGLMRVRCFTQDDAHIFMTQEQIQDEIKSVVKLIDEVYTKFGFQYHVELSTRPEERYSLISSFRFVLRRNIQGQMERNIGLL